MTDPTEAEARIQSYESAEHMALVSADCSPSLATLNAYAEAVRATEREKVRTLVKRLTDDMVSPNDLECWFCGGNGWNKDDFDHTEDCPWVEARLWLDGVE